jgi:hypothetical protein
MFAFVPFRVHLMLPVCQRYSPLYYQHVTLAALSPLSIHHPGNHDTHRGQNNSKVSHLHRDRSKTKIIIFPTPRLVSSAAFVVRNSRGTCDGPEDEISTSSKIIGETSRDLNMHIYIFVDVFRSGSVQTRNAHVVEEKNCYHESRGMKSRRCTSSKHINRH